MPSFPASVWSPTVKSAGSVIDASHINDPQDEIVAIEGGYLNGTARLNSSQSTVVSLSVSSNSTFGYRPIMPPPDAALVFLASTVTLGSSADSTVAWTQQAVSINSSLHSTTTNPQRLTPQSTGLYAFSAQLTLSENSSGFRTVRIVDSSGTVIGQSRAAAFVGGGIIIQAVGLKRYDALGGYAVLEYTGTGHSTLSLSSGVGASWYGVHKL